MAAMQPARERRPTSATLRQIGEPGRSWSHPFLRLNAGNLALAPSPSGQMAVQSLWRLPACSRGTRRTDPQLEGRACRRHFASVVGITRHCSPPSFQERDERIRGLGRGAANGHSPRCCRPRRQGRPSTLHRRLACPRARGGARGCGRDGCRAVGLLLLLAEPSEYRAVTPVWTKR